MSFPCTSCGICCSLVGLTVLKARKMLSVTDGAAAVDGPLKEAAEFPYKFDKTGRCEKLGKDNQCSVYENRPSICSIEKTHAKHHSNITVEEYYKRSAAACNMLIAHAGLDDKYLIDESSLGKS